MGEQIFSLIVTQSAVKLLSAFVCCVIVAFISGCSHSPYRENTFCLNIAWHLFYLLWLLAFFFKSYRCWNAVGEIKKKGTIQVISISKEEFSKLTQRWVKTNILGRLFFVNIKLMHIFCKDIVYIEMAELRFRCLLTFPWTDTYQSDYICVF